MHRSLNSASRPLHSFVAAFILCFIATPSLRSGESGFTSLFNGKNLDGWEGQPELWKVEDGMIVGTTVGHTLESNTFLIYRGAKVSDFQVKVKLRMTGDNNSGVMYRAQPLDVGPYALKGNQMDIHPKLEYQGMYYSEQTGRGIVAERGQKVIVPEETNADGKTTPQVTGKVGVEPSFDLSEWNDYEVIAVGDRLVQKINGVVTVDVTDSDPTAAESGSLGLQLHRGPEMTIYVKDVELKNLKGQEAKEAIKTALEE